MVTLKFITICGPYRVYRNSEGFLEGYKSIVPGKDKGVKHIEFGHVTNATNIERVVTTAKTTEEFIQQTTRVKPRAKKYDPRKDPQQLKIE